MYVCTYMQHHHRVPVFDKKNKIYCISNDGELFIAFLAHNTKHNKKK